MGRLQASRMYAHLPTKWLDLPYHVDVEAEDILTMNRIGNANLGFFLIGQGQERQ